MFENLYFNIKWICCKSISTVILEKHGLSTVGVCNWWAQFWTVVLDTWNKIYLSVLIVYSLSLSLTHKCRFDLQCCSGMLTYGTEFKANHERILKTPTSWKSKTPPQKIKRKGKTWNSIMSIRGTHLEIYIQFSALYLVHSLQPLLTL